MHVHIVVDDAARACAVPPLLLQPIVENAVRHGIAVSSAAGRIAVSGRVAQNRLVIEVEDDGPGVRENGARSGGTGLSNTRERLAQLFGPDHRLDIGSPNGRGTRVRIELPVRTPANGEDASARIEPAHAHRSRG
jgi:LytS/YehU family sensor histidine kinase